MNEDYQIYYRNPFRRFIYLFESARRNMMRMESSAKEEKLRRSMQGLFEIKKRYDSDRERMAILHDMISTLEERLAASACCGTDVKKSDAEYEIARMKAVMRRRLGERDRLRARMDEDRVILSGILAGG